MLNRIRNIFPQNLKESLLIVKFLGIIEFNWMKHASDVHFFFFFFILNTSFLTEMWCKYIISIWLINNFWHLQYTLFVFCPIQNHINFNIHYTLNDHVISKTINDTTVCVYVENIKIPLNVQVLFGQWHRCRYWKQKISW